VKVKWRQSFTLIEVLIIIIILGILATIAFTSFRKSVVNSREKEARAMLNLIAQAEKMYKLEAGVYWPCPNTSSCNTLLDLSIPSGTSRAWDYRVKTRNSYTEFCSDAKCIQPNLNARDFYIRDNTDEPIPGNCDSF